jgi:hypothetical protein
MGVSLLSLIFFYEETKYVPLVSSTSAPDSDPKTNENDKTNNAEVTKTFSTQNNIDKISQEHCSVDQHIPLKTRRQRMSLYSNTPGTFHDFIRHIYQPFLVFFNVPIVMIVAVQVGWQLTLLAMIITTQATLFPLPPYNFGSNAIGNLNLATFIGSIVGILYLGPFSDWSIVQFTKRNSGVYEPEMRLYIATVPAILQIVGLLMYGFGIARVSFSITA